MMRFFHIPFVQVLYAIPITMQLLAITMSSDHGWMQVSWNLLILDVKHNEMFKAAQL